MSRVNLLLTLFISLMIVSCGQPNVQFNYLAVASNAYTTCTHGNTNSTGFNLDPNCNSVPSSSVAPSLQPQPEKLPIPGQPVIPPQSSKAKTCQELGYAHQSWYPKLFGGLTSGFVGPVNGNQPTLYGTGWLALQELWSGEIYDSWFCPI